MSANASLPSGSLHLKLSEQLQALSLVSETLTLRLLELEERLAGLEHQLEGLHQQQSSPGSTESGEVLAATEERIARLEELLSEATPIEGPQIGALKAIDSATESSTENANARTGSSAGRSATIHPLQKLNAEAPSMTADFSEPESELHPFPEDEEQPFMDELSA